MIRVLGGPKRLCDGMTRRDLLHVGSIGLMGLGLERLTAQPVIAESLPSRQARLPGFGRAKSCIMIFLYGSPSQLETFDPKPDAPVEIRGEFGTIETSLPGVRFCEGLPELAKVADKMTILRSVSHPYPVHGVAFATTGNPRMELAWELAPRDQNHWPYMGSVVDYVDGRERPGEVPPLPRNLMLPWAFSSNRVGEVARAGPYGGFLGSAYDPVATQFSGQGVRKAVKTLQEKRWEDLEPYRGVTPESRFQLSSVTSPPPELTLDRLDRRRSLQAQLEAGRTGWERAIEGAGLDRDRAQAYALLSSESVKRAFDLDEEPMATRELYGMTLLGQASLTARRLVEAGGRFISVFWDEYGLAGTGWDTHWDHYPRMREELLPGLDRTLSGLILDLERRGMLDETLVLVLSEHGRTPKIQTGVSGGGRDHWSRCYSLVMAGGGTKPGAVIGRSDKIASDPAERVLSPKDVLATAYHLLGIDPQAELHDRQGRPFPIVPTGTVIPEALA